MRMRFKPYAHDELMAADFHVHEPLIWGGKWHSQYARPEQPFVLELGCGKGGFISQLASAHPENNYLGIDITDKVLILAKRKIEAAYAEAGRPIDNVKIMSTDIEAHQGRHHPGGHRQPHLHQLLQPVEQERFLQQAPPHLPPSAHPVPRFPQGRRRDLFQDRRR